MFIMLPWGIAFAKIWIEYGMFDAIGRITVTLDCK